MKTITYDVSCLYYYLQNRLACFFNIFTILLPNIKIISFVSLLISQALFSFMKFCYPPPHNSGGIICFPVGYLCIGSSFVGTYHHLSVFLSIKNRLHGFREPLHMHIDLGRSYWELLMGSFSYSL